MKVGWWVPAMCGLLACGTSGSGGSLRPDAGARDGAEMPESGGEATYDSPEDVEASASPIDSTADREAGADASASDGEETFEAGVDGTFEAAADGTDDATPDAATDGPPACTIASATDAHYVDGANGVDDASHGGSSGACAYRTIGYALAHAARQIFVAQGTYSAASGEVFPLVLTGRQGLYCSATTISGQGSYMSARAAVVLNGTANSISDCTIVGDGTTGYCVMVESTASPIPHSVENVDASACGDAAVVVDGSNVHVDDCSLSASSVGVLWRGSAQTGEMSANDLFDNGPAASPADIVCSGADPAVTGSANANGSTPAACTGCASCPFD